MTLPTNTIDICICIVFLLLNIIVGALYRGKSKSFREYAIGDKKFSTAVLTATLVATWLSGSLLTICLRETYSRGLYYIIALIFGRTAGLLIMGRVIGPRIGKFINNLSIADSLGTLYGKHVQVIVGIGGVLGSIGYLAIQFKVITTIISILFNYDGAAITIITASILILYARSGGVKAVTFTDVLQFFTFGIFLPILALSIWGNLKDHGQVAHLLTTNPLFDFKEVVKWSPEFIATLSMIVYFVVPSLSPEAFQRMAMAHNATQIKRSFAWATLLCVIVQLCMIWIAILLLIDQPGLNPKELVQYIMDHHAYPGLRGLFAVGVVSLAMSTADSVLNASAVIVANDIVAPFWPRKVDTLKVAQGATLFIGFGALLVTFKVKELLDVLMLSASFQLPIESMPMLLAIFGFQTSRRVALMAMGAGAFTVVACLLVFKSVNSFFPGMIANLVVLLGAHYLLGEKGGWGHNPIEKTGISHFNHQGWRSWFKKKKKDSSLNCFQKLLASFLLSIEMEKR